MPRARRFWLHQSCLNLTSSADLLEPVVLANDKLMLALDTLNQRFGRGTVKVSTQGAFRDWEMRQERKSPNYTTCWYEVPVV